MYQNNNQQQQHFGTQMSSSQKQQIIGSKRPISDESTDISENINVHSASKRFHRMETENDRSPKEKSGEDGVEGQSAEDEEEESNSSSSDVEVTRSQQQQRTNVATAANFAYSAAVSRSLQPLVGIGTLDATTAQRPYQLQSLGQQQQGTAGTSQHQHQQQLRIDLQNPYQLRPVPFCVDAAKAIGGNSEQSTHILRNLQNFYWGPPMFTAGMSHLQAQQSHGIMPAKSTEGPNFQMMAHQQQMLSFGPAVGLPSQYASPFAQQMPHNSSNNHPFGGNALAAPGGATTMLQGTTPFDLTHNNSIDNDSGVGLTDQSGRGDQTLKNESSSTDGTANETGEELTFDAKAAKFVPFPPFVRSVTIDGVQQFRDLELIVYSETPARLTLLGNMTKYPFTLAEIVRRVSPPECLNTSFLSGILRRAKNKDGGKRFRMELQRFNCGVDLQTGRRKTGAITTFTALCERESIQLAQDFDKLAKDEYNGFPDKAMADELCRRTAVNSMEKAASKQLLTNFQNASHILRDAIELLERAIGQETGELASVTPAELVNQQRQMTNSANGSDGVDLMNRIKRFARLSHCFGNRGMLSAWQILLSVFANCELTLSQQMSDYPLVAPLRQQNQAAMSVSADFPEELSTFQPLGGTSGSKSNWMP